MSASISTVLETRDTVMDATTTASSGRSLRVAILLLISVTLAVGAFLAFPLYDDGWLALIIRESGPHALSQYMGDRPLFGLLLESVASFGAANKFVFVTINALLWLVFAFESELLFRKLFPELRNYSIVASCLTLAPIVIETQLSTALVVLPANLAAILSYAAILILLESDRPEESRPFRLVLAAALAASGVALSEYGVASNLVGAVVLVGTGLMCSVRAERRKLSIRAALLCALTAVSYVLFAKTANFNARPDVAPAHALQRGMSKWLEIPFDVFSGAWHAVVGAYASALGNIILAWDSKSTILAGLFGILVAVLLCVAVQNSHARASDDDSPATFFRRFSVLVFAIFAGLLPFSVMGRATTLSEFGSRFRIPIMPVAAAATVYLALHLVRLSFRWVPVMLLGFAVGYVSWISAYSAVERSRAIAAIQGSLRPYVEQSAGYTVAVVPFERFETESTANIASTWPVEVEKKLWVIAQEPASLQFGSRRACRPPAALDVNVRGLTRSGKLDQILWVDARPGKPVVVEPYCETAN